MSQSEEHHCECPHYQQETSHPDQELHRQMNLLLSRLDEQQRHWYVAVESNRVGAGGDRLLAQITGLDEKTIQRGRKELAGELGKSDIEPGGLRCLLVDLVRARRVRSRVHAVDLSSPPVVVASVKQRVPPLGGKLATPLYIVLGVPPGGESEPIWRQRRKLVVEMDSILRRQPLQGMCRSIRLESQCVPLPLR